MSSTGDLEVIGEDEGVSEEQQNGNQMFSNNEAEDHSEVLHEQADAQSTVGDLI